MGINYNTYLKACKQIVQDDRVFDCFRDLSTYIWVSENVNVVQGSRCLQQIEKDNPELMPHLNRFASSDKIGRPRVVRYNEYPVKICPTTARYVKVLSDLITIFGSLDGWNIVEIGGGYGGQCKIIYDWFKPKSYTIIDLPEALAVTGKFLKCFGIVPILKRMEEVTLVKYDLCISNYAFSELDREYQDFYVEKVINHSDRGYMIINFIGQRGEPDAMTIEEIKAIKINGETQEEVPNTGSNLLYTWNLNHK